MLKTAYIPSDCKLGIIVPIYKDGKPKDAANSYRPVTLLPTIYKIFESVIHSRLNKWCSLNSKNFPNSQQHAYQRHIGALTASFSLQETVMSYKEYESPTYAAFLDTSGAFDNVNHCALFYKLYKFGITGKMLRVLINCYTDIKSVIKVNGVTSSEFPVNQGVRQGGVLSTWMYLLFIDNLLCELQSSPNGTCIGHIPTGNPTLADDLTVISPSLSALQSQINTVTTYANLWGYELNDAKCKLVVFDKKVHQNDSITINKSHLYASESAAHVGIRLHHTLKCKYAIEDRLQKARASLFSILTLENSYGDINPLTLGSIVRKTSLPTALYGAELWNNVTPADITLLERFIRLCAKSVQHLPARTRTDTALSMIGWLPMLADVEKRKLSFFHKLCTIPSTLIARQIFDYRLQLFVVRRLRNQCGFIPDIYSILHKYGLEQFWNTYVEQGTIPPKHTWRRIIAKAVSDHHQSAWHHRTNNADFTRMRCIQDNIRPSYIWLSAISKRDTVYAIQTVKIIALAYSTLERQRCRLCDNWTQDLKLHIITECTFLLNVRQKVIDTVNIQYSAVYGARLSRLSGEILLQTLLNIDVIKHYIPDTNTQFSFIRCVCSFVFQILTKYKHYIM